VKEMVKGVRHGLKLGMSLNFVKNNETKAAME